MEAEDKGTQHGSCKVSFMSSRPISAHDERRLLMFCGGGMGGGWNESRRDVVGVVVGVIFT